MGEREHRPAEVLVRMLRTEMLDDPEHWTYARTMLGADEARVFDRLRSAPARRDYLSAHLLARITLAEFLHEEPARMRIVTGPAGRPVLEHAAGVPTVSFCISRADHVAACAVSSGDPIGVDVESVRRIGLETSAASRPNGPAGEHDPRAGLAVRRQLRRTLMIWTLKEAIAKATGTGARLLLEGLTVDPTDGMAAQELVPAADTTHGTWRFAIRRVTSDHIVAVALRCSTNEIPMIRFGAAELSPFATRRGAFGLTGSGRSDIRDSPSQPMGHVGL